MSGQIEERVIGDAAPQEKRQARSQRDVINTIRRVRDGIGRVGLEAEQELRARQDKLERRFDPGVETPVTIAAALIEAQRLLEIAIFERPAISAPRESGEDLAGAGRFILRHIPNPSRRADQNLAAGRCLAHAGLVERPFDGQAVHRRIAGDVLAVHGGSHERLDEIVFLGVAPQDGCG